MLVDNKDICSIHICKIYNDSIFNHTFPNALKNAGITPAHKKAETTKKDNCRPSVSKVFERQMYNQIYSYFTEIYRLFFVASGRDTVIDLLNITRYATPIQN